MGEDSASLRNATPVSVPLLPEWESGVRAFIGRLEQAWKVRCVVLHGSFATGNWIAGSDVDLVVIAEGLPGSFRERLAAISDLLPRGVPMEVLPYTPQEFDDMLDTMHVTALEATSRGIPLVGQGYFQSLRVRLNDMVGRGLRRGRSSWYWEKHLPEDRGGG
ncbi:MAG: nucleotidyltransferase domain-containing protein [Bacillota bacterium]